MRHLLTIAWLVLVLAGAARAGAPLGSAGNPYKLKGPPGAWVTNGAWRMKASGVIYVDTAEAYARLPWNGSVATRAWNAHLKYMREHVFENGSKVALVRFEATNLTGKKQEIGRTLPTWVIRTAEGAQVGNSSHHEGMAMRNLKGAFPAKTRLNDTNSVTGTLVFFLPAATSARLLFFTAARHSRYGESESLVMQLK